MTTTIQKNKLIGSRPFRNYKFYLQTRLLRNVLNVKHYVFPGTEFQLSGGI
jgi:hypothetical protein